MNKFKLKTILSVFVAITTIVWSITFVFGPTRIAQADTPPEPQFWINSISPMGGGISSTFSGSVYFSGALNTDTITYDSADADNATVVLLTGRFDNYSYFDTYMENNPDLITISDYDVETLQIDTTNAAAGQITMDLSSGTLADGTTYTILIQDVCASGHTASEENHWQYCPMRFETFTTAAGGGVTAAASMQVASTASTLCSGALTYFASDINQPIYSFNAYGVGTLDSVKIYSTGDPSAIVDQVKIYRDKTSSIDTNGNWTLEPGMDTLLGFSSADWTDEGSNVYSLTISIAPVFTLPTSDPNGNLGFIAIDLESSATSGTSFAPYLAANSFTFSGTDDTDITNAMNTSISGLSCATPLITVTSASDQANPYMQDIAPTAAMAPMTSSEALGIDFWGTDSTLSSITVDIIVPSGSGFDPQYALNTLAANSADSGVNIYQDDKVNGTQGTYDVEDDRLVLSAAPTWTTRSGSNKRTTLTLSTPITLPSTNASDGSDYFIVIKTSDAPAAGSSFQVRIPVGGFVGTFPSTNFTSSIINIQSGGGMTATGALISEIQTEGGVANDEFIELHNPTNAAIDLSSYSIQYRNASSGAFSKQNLTSTSTIPAYGFFLIAPDAYDGGTARDVANDGFNLVLAGGTVFLVSDQTVLTTGSEATIEDKVAWGTGANLVPEGEAMTAPAADGSIERKSWYQATATDMASGGMDETMGNHEDTDYNLMDFVVQTTSVPQSTASSVENPMENQQGGAGAPVVINEVYYYPATGATAWIELFNRTASAVTLTGGTLTFQSHSVSTNNVYTFPTFSLPANTYATVWWNQAGTDTLTDLYTGNSATTVSNAMTTLAGDLTLVYDGANTKDYVQYGAINQPSEAAAVTATQWVNDHVVPGVLKSQSIGRNGTMGDDSNRDDDWQMFSSPTEGSANSGGDSFPPAAVTSVVLADNDDTSFGLTGEDVTVTWTADSTTDSTFEKYVIYILPTATALNVTNHTSFTEIYSGQTTATFTGNPGMTLDSAGDALATGDYRAYVVAQDSAGNRSSAVTSAAAALATTNDNTAAGADTQDPFIMHMGVWQAQEGDNIVLIARIADDRTLGAVAGVGAQVVWKSAATAAALDMTSGTTATNCVALESDFYSCTISSANAVEGQVVGYYLRSEDAAGNLSMMSSSPSTDSATYANDAVYEAAVQATRFIIDILADTNYIDADSTVDLTGTVYASNGSVLEGAYLFFEGSAVGTAQTNASGVFSFADNLLMPGSWPLMIFKNGYMDMYANAFKQESNLTFYLNSGTTQMGGGDDGSGYMELPSVIYSNPNDGMFGAPTAGFAMTIGFSKAMDSNTIVDNDASNAGSNIYLTTDGTDRVAGAVAYNTNNDEATFTVTSGTTLTAGTAYTMVITTAVTDTLGNSISGGWRADGAVEITFNTMADNSNMWGTGWEDYMTGGDSYGGEISGGGGGYAGMDFTDYGQSGQMMPPYVMSTTPQPGSTGVARNNSIIVEFSEPMTSSTIDTDSIVLYPITDTSAWTVGTAVTATVSLDSATQRIVTLAPSSNLDLNSAGDGWYVLKIMGSVQSAAGVWMGDPRDCGTTDPNTCLASLSDYEMSFQLNTNADTASDTTSPTVTGTYPNNNDGITNNLTVDVGIPSIEVGFSESMNPGTINTQSVTLQAGSRSVSGKVTYDASSFSARFVPGSALLANTRYTLTASTTITDLAGNQLDQESGTAGLQGKVVEFKTGSADTTAPTVLYANGDDYTLAITYSEPMISAKQTDTSRWASSVINPANYYIKTVDSSSVGAGTYSSVTQVSTISGVSLAYDEPTNTVTIEGFGISGAADFQIFVDDVTDKSNNTIANTGGRVVTGGNGTQSPLQSSADTYGMLGPGGPGMMMMGPSGGGGPMGGPSGSSTGAPMMDMGAMGMMSGGAWPMNSMAGQTSSYMVDVPLTRSLPVGSTIVLTFPVGFNVTNAAEDTNSPMNNDINDWGTGTITIADVTASQTARTVTITTGGAATQATDFLHMDLTSIVNSSVPKEFGTEGYTVDIKTFSSGVMLETITCMPFYISEAGTNTISGTVTAAGATTGTMSVYLGSPMTGPMETEIDFSTLGNGTAAYSFTNLPDGDYHIFTEPTVPLGATTYYGSHSHDSIWLSGSDATKNITLEAEGASGIEVVVHLTGDFTTGGSNDDVDIFANSYNNFRVKTVTPGSTADTDYSLYLADGDWMIGIGPAMPKGPMAGPPPMPDWMPPMSIDVKVADPDITENSDTADDGTIVFNISGQVSNTLIGTVVDGDGTAIADAEVFAHQPMGGFGGSFTRTDASGGYELKFPVLGMYKVGAHKPGLPEPKEKTVDVRADGNYVNGASIASLELVMQRPSYTISGKVLNASQQAMAYAPVWAYQPTAWGHAHTMTDASGNYILYVDNGTWTVEADAPGVGWLQHPNLITINDASQSNINLQPDTDTTWITVSGTISINDTAQTYMPVSASQFTDSDTDGTPDYYNGREFGGMTDSSGAYSIDLPGGANATDYKYYEIHTWTPDFGMVGLSFDEVASSPANIKISDTATTTANITITSGSLNTVTMTFANKADYSGDAFINIEGVSYTGTTPFPTGYHKSIRVADISGADPTVDLVAGDYLFHVTVPGTGDYMPSKTNSAAYDNTKGCITVDGTSDTLQFDLPDLDDAAAMITISGTVSGPDAGQRDAWVSIGNMATGFHSGMQAASSTGAYSLVVPILSSGTYMIGADKPGFVSGEPTSNAGTADATVNITLTAAANTISGNIFTDSGTDDDTYTSGEEIANGWVHAEEINTGAESFAPVDGGGAYSLAVTDGEWKVYGSADGYSETQYVESDIPATVTVSGDSPTANVELPADANWESKTKSSSITPSSGGVVDDTAQDATTGKTSGTGVKLTLPPNALGSDSSAGNVSAAATAAVSASDSMKPFAGEGKNITALDNSGQPLTLDNYIDIEIVTYKAEVDEEVAAGEIVDESKLKTMKIGYWDETVNEWVNEPTTKTAYYKDDADTEWTMYNSTTTDDGFTTGHDLFIDEALGDNPTFVEGIDFDDYKFVYTASVNHLTVYAAGTSPDGVAPSAPIGLAQTSGAGTSVGLSWTAPTTNADATALTDLYGYAVYRSTDGTTYTQVSTSAILAGTTTYTDSSTSAFTSYYYKVTAGDDDDTESAYSTALQVCSTNSIDNGSVGADCSISCNSGYTASGNSCVASGGGGVTGGGGYSVPAPSNASIVINDGAATTNSRDVELTLSVSGATQMAISNQSNFSTLAWEPTKTTKSWTLTAGDGLKTVYAKFKNSSGVQSSVVSDTITLSTSTTPVTADETAAPVSTPVAETPVSYQGKLVKDASSPAVYLIENDKKRPIVSAKAFESYGYNWEDIQAIDDLSIFSTGEVLQGSPGVRSLIKGLDNKVYFVALGNIKRWITSEAIFLTLGYKWSDVITVTDAVLGGFETGEDLAQSTSRPDGSLVKYPGNPKVYLIENNRKRWVATEEEFNKQGYSWGDIIEISINETYLDGVTMGGGSVLGVKTSRLLTSFLTLGSSGQAVRLLQDKLKELGHFSQDVKATGYFGPVTQRAVKKFQAANGIEAVGYVGPKTREALNSL